MTDTGQFNESYPGYDETTNAKESKITTECTEITESEKAVPDFTFAFSFPCNPCFPWLIQVILSETYWRFSSNTISD